MASLTELPHDLLRAIICPENVDYDDIVNLRLTCHVLKDVTTPILFYRIYISQLTRDRDAFLAISNSDLATHVVEMEWQEVSWHEGYFLQAADYILPGRQLEPDPDTEGFSDTLDEMAACAFWLQIPYPSPQPAQNEDEAPPEDEARQDRKRAIHDFRKIFNSALGRFPNLRTIVSRPMPFDRVIYVPGVFDYPITAKLFQTHHRWNADESRPSRKHGNDGLFKFILPAMEDNLVPSVTRLLWEDECPGGSQYRPRPKAFAQLESLSLYFISNTRLDYENLVANLDGATNVRHLSLMVQEPRRTLFSAQTLERAMLRMAGKGGPTRWKKLQSLSVVGMDTLDGHLVDLVANNADSLRHVYLRNCLIRYATVKALAKIPHVCLKTISLTEDSYDFFPSGPSRVRLCSEAALLDKINREVPDAVQSEAVEKGGHDDLVILTKEVEEAEFPSYSHRTACTSHLDARAIFKKADFPRDGDEDEEESVCSQDSEDSLDRRIRTGPRWRWSRFFHEEWNGSVYYKQVPDSDPRGAPTVVWRFTYRDGTVNYGADPLMWFDDWDPEAGDVEEPTPYCRRFLNFLKSDECERDHEPIDLESFLGQGEAFELLQNLRPPEGYVEYGDDTELWSNSWSLYEGNMTPPPGAEFYY